MSLPTAHYSPKIPSNLPSKLPGSPSSASYPKPVSLYGITVDDLITRLDARYALQLESGDALVEHVMVGANVLDAEDFPAGPEYYGQRSNKAVIGRGDRPDFHWSAIDTPTRCVILTGNFEPIPYLLAKAEERQVPVAVVDRDTLDVMDTLEDIFNGPALDSQVPS